MKLFYSIRELADILEEDIFSVADALCAIGVKPTRNGKPYDLTRWARPRPIPNGGTIFVRLNAPRPDHYFPEEFIVLADHLPATWIAHIQGHGQSADEKTSDESALSYENDHKALAERITHKPPAESDSKQSAIVDTSQTEADRAPSPALADFRSMNRLSWNEIQIDFVAGESGSPLLNISARQKARRITFAELELVNRKTGDMNHQCGALLAIASGQRLPTTPEMPRRVSRLRTALKKHFGIDSDPFETYNDQAGYKPAFGISDKRNAADERARKNAERKTISYEDWKEHKSGSENRNIDDDDSNDDEATRWFMSNAPDMMEDDDLS